MPLFRRAKVTNIEYYLGIAAILIVLEAGRRCWYNLPVLASVFLLYCYYGRYAPGLFMHRDTGGKNSQHMCLVPEGIYRTARGFSHLCVPVYSVRCIP